ncbi:MAG: phosphatidylglycerophosphatase A [Deltaproteobacteria bacterium]|jgi:phosphatidylglycerophosphatase A|nr:phosphatidylglycerophosphatase A [Deltaproteobacteria bacterium]MBW2482043.1 phosphatidylglycerophosphatase A [Deltaproteobacteria bacterium]
MNFANKTAVFLATGLYVGKVPLAPGTFGSLLGLPLCFLLDKIQLSAAIAAVLLIIALATWIADAAERILGRPDPGCIVIDEIAGMAVTLIGLPFNPTTVAVGFILFRILDILKPFPIRVIDKRLPGGLGIVADDVIAGIFSNFLLRILLFILE